MKQKKSRFHRSIKKIHTDSWKYINNNNKYSKTMHIKKSYIAKLFYNYINLVWIRFNKLFIIDIYWFYPNMKQCKKNFFKLHIYRIRNSNSIPIFKLFFSNSKIFYNRIFMIIESKKYFSIILYLCYASVDIREIWEKE